MLLSIYAQVILERLIHTLYKLRETGRYTLISRNLIVGCYIINLHIKCCAKIRSLLLHDPQNHL